MPRNGSGTSSVVNTFVIDTIADPDEVNANFTDVADQLTNSLPRDGQAGMNAPLPLQNGTNSAPALTFSSDTDTGIYRSGTNKVGISAGGTASAIFTASGVEDTVAICDPSDNTKQTRIDAGAITTASTRVMSAPDRDINISAVPKGYLYGLTLSNNVSDATNDIDIAAGEASDDGSTPWIMILASALTKRLDASWAVGTNQGGLDTGSKASGTTYFVWLIQRSDTGVVDALFSTSSTSPTMPTNYDRKRLIGVVMTDGSSVIRPFTMNPGDDYTWTTPVADVVNFLMGTSSGLMLLTLPNGVKVKAKITAAYTSATITSQALISSPDQGTLVAGINNSGGNLGTIQVTNGFVTADLEKWSNTSQQLRYVATANGNLWVWTNGFKFPCGRN